MELTSPHGGSTVLQAGTEDNEQHRLVDGPGVEDGRGGFARLFCYLFLALGIALCGLPILVRIAQTTQHSRMDRLEVTRAYRLAFGSCSQRTIGENSIWQDAVVPSRPDAWIWLGDMAYMDIPAVDCYKERNQNHPDCNCEPTVFRHPSHGCKSGDEQNARRKVDGVVRTSGYEAFLAFMCPDHWLHTSQFPPPGGDASVCPRPIYGVYDDHDFAWNNGNGYQLAKKSQLKQVFLDAIGEPEASPRRAGGQGIFELHKLNQGIDGRDIDLILLDERFYRVPLPCHTRREFCNPAVNKSKSMHVWCGDFLGTDNITGPPSCCRKDDDIALNWCAIDTNKKDPRFSSACDPWDPSFGTVNWVLSPDGSLVRANPSRWEDVQDESCFCEVLGTKQRQWLNETLDSISAPVMLVGSGSVLLGSPQKVNHASDDPPFTGYCSGDDWDCYRPAQQNLLAMLSRTQSAKQVCVIVLTGDYHYADIKRIIPREKAKYSEFYEPPGLMRPVWQLMASGMHPDLADGIDTGCGDLCCGYKKDLSGLRGPKHSCHIFGDPNFGVIDFDWKNNVISMAVISGATGDVAIAADGAALQVNISMTSCERIA